MIKYIKENALFTPFLTYYLLLIVYFTASFFPDFRLWGFNQWAYYPVYVPVLLFAVGAVIPWIALTLVTKKSKQNKIQSRNENNGRYYLLISLLLIILFAAAFYIFRGKFHFLGDGNLLLSILPSLDPRLKLSNFGGGLVPWFVNTIISENVAEPTLISYQVASYTGGLIFLLGVVYYSRLLFQKISDRVIFPLGLASGGYMLLFFGYVENYSLFVPIVALYSLYGLYMAKQGSRNWLVLLVLLILSLFFHVLAAALIPSALYLLISNTSFSRKISGLNAGFKTILILIGMVILAGLFYYFYNSSYFFRFAIIPLIENRFTVEGYTLFSVNHLVDYINLMFLLFPGVLLLLVVINQLSLKKIFRKREYKFLLLLLFSTCGAVFIFDPKLGMPRDWDLFSFCGFPIVLFGYYFVLDNQDMLKSSKIIAVLSITLGFLILAPRVVGQMKAEVALPHIESYARLDVKKNMYVYQLLEDYYQGEKDLIRSAKQYKNWKTRFPEWDITEHGRNLKEKGSCPEAISFFKRAIAHNPMFAAAYYHLGSCYLSLNLYDSAYTNLKIAEGMNSNSPYTLNELGYACIALKKYEEAEKNWKKSLIVDKDFRQAYLNLLELYSTTGNDNEYIKLLMKVTQWPDAPVIVYKKLGDYYLKNNDMENARTAYKTALKNGLDSSAFQDVYMSYPQILE